MLIYHGALTFDHNDPASQLRVPNQIAAERIAGAVLAKYDLKTDTLFQLKDRLDTALRRMHEAGDPVPSLGCYERLMTQRDVGFTDFEKGETNHRDLCFHVFQVLPIVIPEVEYNFTKVICKPCSICRT